MFSKDSNFAEAQNGRVKIHDVERDVFQYVFKISKKFKI